MLARRNNCYWMLYVGSQHTRTICLSNEALLSLINSHVSRYCETRSFDEAPSSTIRPVIEKRVSGSPTMIIIE